MQPFRCGLALCVVAAVVAAPVAVAQSAMPKSIRIVVPFSPGGSNDVIARAIAGPLGRRLDILSKIRMTHVPYKGASNAAVDLAGGQIDVMVSNYSTIAPLMKSGKIRALAVTSAAPHAAFPDLPPLATVAPGFAVAIWVGV